MLNDKMRVALNQQVNAELWSAYLYLSMSLNFEDAGLKGIANWFKVQFQEEQAHAEIFMNYLVKRNARVELLPLDPVAHNWETPEKAYMDTLTHEQKVTAMINDLYALSEEVRDYATKEMLLWFISEQAEEEDTARHYIDRFRLVGDNGTGILLLDQELAARTYVVPAPLAAAANA